VSARSVAARIGGLTRASLYDGKEVTAPARSAFLRRFELQVDPEGTLPEEERSRRIQAALRAHMARLALKSAKARRKRAAS
jgi:hypothetical protein